MPSNHRSMRSAQSARAAPSARGIPALERNGYTVGKTVGVGAYAKVKTAVHTPTGKKCAIKIVCKRKAPDGYVNKFLPREVQAMLSTDHPNIIQLHETIEDPDRFFFVTELAAGGDLLEYINTNGPLPDSVAKRLFRQLVEAIDHCHSRGVVHRDLKCENILLSGDMNIKVGDFGFARKIDNLHKLLATHCGSYAYAAPEILTNRPYSGPETDVWSLGIILFAVVAGRLPFNDGDGLGTLLREIQRGVAVPHRMTAQCANLLKKILVAKPTSRLTTGEILAHPWLAGGRPSPGVRASEPARPSSVQLLPALPGQQQQVDAAATPAAEVATAAAAAAAAAAEDDKVQAEGAAKSPVKSKSKSKPRGGSDGHGGRTKDLGASAKAGSKKPSSASWRRPLTLRNRSKTARTRTKAGGDTGGGGAVGNLPGSNTKPSPYNPPSSAQSSTKQSPYNPNPSSSSSSSSQSAARRGSRSRRLGESDTPESATVASSGNGGSSGNSGNSSSSGNGGNGGLPFIQTKSRS